ncbi:MAG: hypothetical protein GX100_08730 [candidate division WS1 bacterium]|jgi:hypothetical protein|nr:hypothetical protein [candidate division WS1 bacterium]
MITSPGLPLKREVIRLAMLGCTSGNGQPYSWSAIFNGYDRALMTAERPFPFAETFELMHLLIGGLRSREEGGREIQLEEIQV